MTVQRVRIIKGGKRVIPAPMRREMGIATGDTALVEIKGGELRLRSVAQAVARAQAILRRHVPEGVFLADELIADARRSVGKAVVLNASALLCVLNGKAGSQRIEQALPLRLNLVPWP